VHATLNIGRQRIVVSSLVNQEVRRRYARRLAHPFPGGCPALLAFCARKRGF
jgi:hypothetical protein